MSAVHTAQIPEDSTGRPRQVVVGGIRLPRTFDALRYRNFRLFLTGQFVSLIGTWMEQTAMGWLVYQLTDSKFMLGLVAAAGTAPMLFLSMWGGSLADRHSKRTIVEITQAAQMVLAFALAALVWIGGAQAWQIVVISLLGGVAMAFDMPARQSFIVEMTSREDLMNAVSLNSSVFNAARIVGPGLAGFVMAHSGAAMCFFINGVSFLAVLATLRMMRLAPHQPVAQTLSAREHALSGLQFVWNHQRVLTIFTLFGIVGVFGWSYSVLMPAIARDVLHLRETGYGALLSATSVGAVAGALCVATIGDRYLPRVIALNGVWMFSGALLGFALLPNFYAALLFLALAGFGMMLFFSTVNTTVQRLVPDDMRGRVMGVWSLVFGAMIPLGSLEAGALAKWIGAPWAVAIGAVVCAISGIVTLVVVRRREAQLQAAATAA